MVVLSGTARMSAREHYSSVVGVWENNKITLCPRGCQRKPWITGKGDALVSAFTYRTQKVGNRKYNRALKLPLVPLEGKLLNIQPGAKTTYVTC